MNPLDREKAYAYAVDEQLGTDPLSSANIALTINSVALNIKDRKTPSIATVKRWYLAYLSDGRAQIGIRDGGVRCNH
ncbi:MAG: hypothetical protein ACI9N9_002371 [Enterobacterales bacterium]|jgi:hypothetical protein